MLVTKMRKDLKSIRVNISADHLKTLTEQFIYVYNFPNAFHIAKTTKKHQLIRFFKSSQPINRKLKNCSMWRHYYCHVKNIPTPSYVILENYASAIFVYVLSNLYLLWSSAEDCRELIWTERKFLPLKKTCKNKFINLKMYSCKAFYLNKNGCNPLKN